MGTGRTTHDEGGGEDDTRSKVFGHKEDVSHDTSSLPGLSVDIFLMTDGSLPSSADKRDDNPERGGDEDNKDGTDVKGLVVVGNLGGVTVGELFGGTVAVVVADCTRKGINIKPLGYRFTETHRE